MCLILLLLLAVAGWSAENLDALKPTPTMDELLKGTRPADPPKPVGRNTTVITTDRTPSRCCCTTTTVVQRDNSVTTTTVRHHDCPVHPAPTPAR